MTAVHPQLIPAELRERDQWVAWKREERDGKQTKVPYVAGQRQGARAESDDPTTWGTYEAALASLVWADGIGFMFAEDDPFSGLDLDRCRDPETRRLHPEAARIVLAFNSYSEASPTGDGVHIFVRATKPGPRCRTSKVEGIGKVEMYDRLRFFTVTGQQVHGQVGVIEERQAELDALYTELFPPAEAQPRRSNGIEPIGDDRDLIDRALSASNGDRFAALWNGSWQGAYPSQSEADAALCSMLAFWTAGDAARVDALFRQSGLYRRKWERADYRIRTITFALTAGGAA